MTEVWGAGSLSHILTAPGDTTRATAAGKGPGTTALGAFRGDFARDRHGKGGWGQLDRPAPRDKDGLPAPGTHPSIREAVSSALGRTPELEAVG